MIVGQWQRRNEIKKTTIRSKDLLLRFLTS